MSIDYAFYKRSDLGKHYSEIKKSGNYEEHRISEAEILCSLMELPEIPYYFCSEYDFPVVEEVDNDRYWKLYFKLDAKYCRYDLHRYIMTSNRDKLKETPISKEYKQYKHWEDWGLKKLDNIKIEEILDNPKIKRKDIYGNSDTLEEIKEDIKKFLWYYKNHYYRFTVV